MLFAIAATGDRRGRAHSRVGARPVIYALSLAVYCTSWTFFGNVGTASKSWSFLPIYLGPAIALLLFSPVLRKMLLVAKQQNTTSIADFIAARYGKAQGLAAMISAIALLVILPYIALQLKALTVAFATLTQGAHLASPVPATAAVWRDTGFYVAALMALFTIVFGTRHVNPRESHQGIIMAIAFESVVKLLAFVTVGAFVVYGMFDGIADVMARARHAPAFAAMWSRPWLDAHFMTTSLLAVMAIFCLPRQFHVGVVENTDIRDLRTARWLYPGYLIAMALFVVPLAGAGLLVFGAGSVDPDRFVLALPMSAGAHWVAVIGYIGGMSAGTSMAIMATVTLSTMLCNDLVLPLALRLGRFDLGGARDLGRTLLRIRRALIVAILALAWLCYRVLGQAEALASIGLLSFAGAALFIPPLIGGLYLRGIGRKGVVAGLAAGIVAWGYTLVAPALAAAGWFDTGWIAAGPLGIDWLAPQALFGYGFGDPLTHGVFWTLGTEITVTAAVSVNSTPNLIERAQARAFVELGVVRAPRRVQNDRRPTARVAELEVLLQRFLGPQTAHDALRAYRSSLARPLLATEVVDAELLSFAERRLAGVVGSASARIMLASGLGQHDLAVDDLVGLLDRAAEAVQFNRGVLQAALENIDQGISVVDQELRLVAWNNRYLALFDYPPGLVRCGRPIAELIRYNASRGECGPGPVAQHVNKRLAHMRAGRAYRFERRRHDDTVLQIVGNPMPGGGFVTTFSDITAFKRHQAELTRFNQQLEARVAKRTAALSRANARLRAENVQRAHAEHQAKQARREAERANLSKTRFFAAASHDLLQPLHAARLFAASAPESGNRHPMLARIQDSLGAAQRLLEPLLDISRIDAGAWQPDIRAFAVAEVLDPLAAEFHILAADAGLRLASVSSGCYVYSDPALLRRILQNFLANAVRYTQRGRILIGVRRASPDALQIQVWDTGPGIPADETTRIFDEFQRGTQGSRSAEHGQGLGLSLADRMARLLGHTIDVRSREGAGTVFSLRVARAPGRRARVYLPQRRSARPAAGIRHILCVEDDGLALGALIALLESWQMQCVSAPAANAAAIAADGSVDAAIIDYNLGADQPDGLSLIERLQADHGLLCVLVTADRDRALAERARGLGVTLLYKPIAPARLRAALAARAVQTGLGAAGSLRA